MKNACSNALRLPGNKIVAGSPAQTMMHEFKTGSLLVRYLLGEASPEERSGLEAKYLTDADLFEEVVAAENDLIDAYAAGQLFGSDRKRFEEHFLLTAERQQRVEFAKALLNQVTAEPGGKQQGKTRVLRFPPPTAWHWPRSSAVWLGLLAFLAIVTWSIWTTLQNFQLRRESASFRAEIAALQGKQRELQQQIEASQKLNDQRSYREETKATPSIVVVTLNAGISRGDNTQNRVIIASETQSVRLHLLVDGDGYSKLDASVETANGNKIWNKDNLLAHGSRKARVDLALPARILANGDYIVNLTEVTPGGKFETINSYAFKVVKR